MVIEPRCAEEMRISLSLCRRAGVPCFVIGGGSNLLISDKGVPGAVIVTRKMRGITRHGGVLRVACGTPMPALLRAFAAAGDNRLLFAAGIPGTVGGGLYMNAGTEGHGIAEMMESVCVVDGKTLDFKTLFLKECNISYRKTIFQTNSDQIVSADFPVRYICAPEEIFAQIRKKLERRKAVQPLDFPNAGSVFKRHDSAVALSRQLDELGLRGRRVGDAAVSEKHAGFIINLGNATATDVVRLMREVQTIAERSLGFCPEPEIRRIPDDDEFFNEG